jgi:hypothetical protein
MRHYRHKLVTAAALATGMVVAVAVDPASAGVVQSRQIALNNPSNGRSVEKVGFTLSEHAGPNEVVGQKAHAQTQQCEGCDTAAISIDVVLVDGPANRVQLHQSARAVTMACVECDTVAANRLFVVTGSGDLTLSDSGRRTLNGIGADLEGLANAGLGASELLAGVDGKMAAISSVLDTKVTQSAPVAGRPKVEKKSRTALNRSPEGTVSDEGDG